MAELNAQTFAGYEIISKLGQGGMGAVYKARQPMLSRVVALKVMSADLARDADFVARFQGEAAAAANLSHPNIVGVYASGEFEGMHFMAMEFIEGESLRQRIERRGKMDAREAVAAAVYVAQALEYGWNKARLIHRDIKPDNVFLSNAGEVKLGDLGLAKSVGGGKTSLTQTGMMMGSPHYISPEQARGAKDIDFRADMYSLGCTLYHMLTGRPPYDGDDPMAVMMKHVNDPPPAIFKTLPHCPMPLGMLVGKMLAKNRTARFQSYEELIEELERVHELLGQITKPDRAVPSAAPTQAGFFIPTPTPRVVAAPRKRSAAVYAVAGVAAVAVIGGLLYLAPWKRIPPGTAAPRVVVINDAFVREVAALPAEQQVQRVMAKLKELNPGFDGKETHRIADGVVLELKFSAEHIINLSPVRALTKLRQLDCRFHHKLSPLTDLSPLAGMSLNMLACAGTKVSDLTPLKGMKLTQLFIYATDVQDLSPLKGMPLEQLAISGSAVADLSPLKGMPLKSLIFQATKVSDLSPLQGMKLERLDCYDTQVRDLTPLSGVPLTSLNLRNTPVSDISVIKGMPLKSLDLDYRHIASQASLLQSVRSLQTINQLPVAEALKKARAQPVPAVGADGAAWKNAVNLLPLINPQRDTVAGEWRIENGELIGDKAGFARIELPYQPPEEYDYRVEFTSLTDGTGGCQHLAKAGHGFTWNFFGAGGRNIFGFEAINGETIHGNLTKTVLPPIERRHRYVSLVEVRNDGLKAFLDGGFIVSWKTRYNDLKAWTSWQLRDPTLLGVGCQSRMIFHRIEVREVTGKGRRVH